jgi:DNA-binding response OmpR family regulator
MKRILLVDDEVDLLNMVKLFLERSNYKVCAISDWESIPGTIDSFNPHLIILDISLRGADGRMICKQIKQNSPTAHISVLLCSGNSKVKHSIAEFLADGFLEKPFGINDLLKEIESILPVAI